MRHIASLSIAALMLFTSYAVAGGEAKQVCHDKTDKAGAPVIDKKSGKPAQDCKTIKVHKKLEGTEVPTKK